MKDLSAQSIQPCSANRAERRCKSGSKTKHSSRSRQRCVHHKPSVLIFVFGSHVVIGLRTSPEYIYSVCCGGGLISFGVQVEARELKSCSICQEPFNGEAAQLPCRHHFHEACVQQWLVKQRTCPLCRHQLPIDTINDTMFWRAEMKVYSL